MVEVWVILILDLIAVRSEYPCTSYTELARAEYRGGQCSYVSGTAVCDMLLTAGWYRAVGLNGSLIMQETPANLLTCGTKFPYWMNGTHPTVADGIVSRQICETAIDSYCVRDVTIQVKNCSTYYAYELQPLPGLSNGYCFGEFDECPPFDPCDIYGHKEVEYNAGRSSSCNVHGISTCDTYNGTDWLTFKKSSSSYLQIGSTCPSEAACGTEFPLWISGTNESFQNGSELKKVCLRNNTDCYGMSFNVMTKNCGKFSVYQLTTQDDICDRYCLDDSSAVCPTTTTPTTVTTTTTTTATTTTTTTTKPDTQNGQYSAGQSQEKPDDNPGNITILIILLCLVVLFCISIASVYVRVEWLKTSKTNQKVGDSTLYNLNPTISPTTSLPLMNNKDIDHMKTGIKY